MIVTRADLEVSLAALRTQIPDPSAGILGPRSIGWQIGGDLAVFLGGGRAALLQLAHPFVAYAIAQHSHTRDDAFAAARRVHAVHSAIHGTIPPAIGGWPAGARYHANDADALR